MYQVSESLSFFKLVYGSSGEELLIVQSYDHAKLPILWVGPCEIETR